MNPRSNRFFHHACLFETGLIPVAYILAWFAGIDPAADLYFSQEALGWGIIGSLPLYLLFIHSYHHARSAEMQRIRRLLLDVLGTPLARCHWSQLLILAMLAGIAEEFLFRGVLQPWLENSWTPATGLIGTSVLFGLLHFITPMYALLTTLGSLYLGIMLDVGEQRNLLTPMLIHGIYDFLAFLVIAKTVRNSLPRS